MGSQSSQPTQQKKSKDWYVRDYQNKLTQSTHLLDDGTYQTNEYGYESQVVCIIYHTKKDDIANGKKLKFYGGVILSKHTIVDGFNNGPYEMYYDGKLSETGSVKGDVKFGVVTCYNGYVNKDYNYKDIRYDKIEKTYDSGILHGVTKCYKDGKLVKIQTYNYGTITSTNDNPEEEKQPEKTLPSAPPTYRPKSEVDFPEVEKAPVKLEFPEVPKEEELVEGETSKKVVEA
jgi:hypothetical protein